MRFAPTMSQRLRLDSTTIMHAHDIVCSVMGTEWHDEQDRSRRNPATSIADIHPLYLALRGSTEACVVEVLQLAAYLCTFQGDPRLGAAIASLRDAGKYGPTIVELDLAWKFRNAGATVLLAPLTPNGIGDFAAAIDGATHIIETSGFPSDPLGSPVMSFMAAMESAFRSALRRIGHSGFAALELDVIEVSGSIRSAAYAAIREVVKLFLEHGCAGRVEQHYAFGTIAVGANRPGQGPDAETEWTMSIRSGVAPLSPRKALGETRYRIQGDGTWVLLCDRSVDPDPYARLRAKLKREARQLRGCDNAVVILEMEALGLSVFDDVDKLKDVAQQFFRNHSSTTAVAIIVRPEKLNGTRGIAGHYFTAHEGALSPSFWQRVLDVDGKANILDELVAIVR